MARPKPRPENTPIRTSISLPLKTHACLLWLQDHGHASKDYSEAIGECVTFFMQQKHGGMMDFVLSQVRIDNGDLRPSDPKEFFEMKDIIAALKRSVAADAANDAAKKSPQSPLKRKSSAKGKGGGSAQR